MGGRIHQQWVVYDIAIPTLSPLSLKVLPHFVSEVSSWHEILILPRSPCHFCWSIVIVQSWGFGKHTWWNPSFPWWNPSFSFIFMPKFLIFLHFHGDIPYFHLFSWWYPSFSWWTLLFFLGFLSQLTNFAWWFLPGYGHGGCLAALLDDAYLGMP